jgi:hypothetical protein
MIWKYKKIILKLIFLKKFTQIESTMLKIAMENLSPAMY